MESRKITQLCKHNCKQIMTSKQTLSINDTIIYLELKEKVLRTCIRMVKVRCSGYDISGILYL